VYSRTGNGCGDHEGLESDAFCYLIDQRARVLVYPALLAARAAGAELIDMCDVIHSFICVA